jgi:glucose/arabinose dehydrogenase
LNKGRRPAQFGRLAGLAVAADGALLIAEDQNGVIYRVSYGP